MSRFYLPVIFVFFSLVAIGNGHEIEIQINGLEDTSALVGYHYGSQRLILDTFAIDTQNRIVISGDNSLPSGVYFVYTPSFYFEFLIKEQVFKLSLDDTTGYKNMKVEGSLENQLFASFQNRMSVIQSRQQELSGLLASATPKDSALYLKELTMIASESNAFRDSIIETHPDTFFASFIGLMKGITVPDFEELDNNERKQEQYRYYKEHYFDLVQDPLLLMRTPVFHGYVMKYFNELVVPQPDSVNREIKAWLEPLEGDKDALRYWLMTLSKKYQESNIMGMDGVTVFLADNYFLTDKIDFMSDKQKMDIAEELKFVRPNLLGNLAPALMVLDTALSPFNIAGLNDRYLVLFFYDPDCGHCRKKTPILRDAYVDLKDVGAEVVAVCTITDTKKWKDFIINNKLEWINLGDPYYKSNFRMEYNTRTTPQLYVLDKDRKIIAKKLPVEQVVDFIRDYDMLVEQEMKE